MPKKQRKNKKPSQVWKKYKIDDKVNRAKTCPRCGPGVFMAMHKNRYYCGKCYYTIFNKD